MENYVHIKSFFLNLRVDVPVRFVVFVFSLLHSIFILLEGGVGGGGGAEGEVDRQVVCQYMLNRR